MKVAICILFYEKVDQTIECVDGFWHPDVHIYIVNNGSSDTSRSKLGDHCAKYSNVTIFDSPENLGVSGGRNYLITHTTEPWMLFVDNDITPKTEDWFQNIKNHIEHESGIEVFIPRLYNILEKKYSIYSGFYISDRHLKRNLNLLKSDINSFPGGSAFINRSMFDRLGLYDEAMFVAFEDFELAVRGILSNQPVQARKITDIEFIHDHRVAQTAEDKQSVMVRYDHDKHKVSYEHIAKKHNLIFEDNWEDWLQLQVDLLVHGKQYQKTWKDYFLVRAARYGWKRLVSGK